MTKTSAPSVSVIIPCYNADRFIGDAVESALRQSHAHVEVIVVDDGSTDASLEEIHRFGDRVRVHTGPNRGVCAAQNTGFDMALGDWIQFLGADDLLHPRKFAVSLTAHAAFPDLPFVWAPLLPVEAQFRLPLRLSMTEDDPVRFAGKCATNALQAAFAPATALFQKVFLTDIGPWDTSLKRWTDLEFHARIAARRPSYIALPEPLYFYRQHDGPRISSANSNFTGLANGRLSLEKARAALEPVWPDKYELAHYLAPFYLNLARSAAANGNLRQFRELLCEADRLRGEWGFHLKCIAALASASVVGPLATSRLIERILADS